MKKIACLGDTSTHGGSISNTNQTGSLTVIGTPVAVNGAKLQCPTHGEQTITAVTVKTFHEGKLIITEGATAACGATITPAVRGVYVE